MIYISSYVLALELLIYFAFAIIISFHLADKHQWHMPFEPIIHLWTDCESHNINIVGKILAQLLATVFTVRFALVGYIMLGIYYFGVGVKHLFIWLFSKH
jgi:hypothetical protein